MKRNKINLNSIIYNERLTREDIFDRISQEQIYTYYIGDNIVSGTRINSPLREDNVPSFSIYYHRNNNKILMFNDFATSESGDCIIFVCKLFNLSYTDALFKIAFDFGLSDIEISTERRQLISKGKVTRKEQVQLGIKSRPWKIRDKKFWSQFGIKKQTLIKYNVVPISYVFFNGNPQKVSNIAYAYIEYKDEQISYKIYQPYNVDHKWINNANYTVHQGYTQLPKTDKLLVITKSLKDVMSIHDIIKVSAVALQSESVLMKDSVMDEYKSRFDQVVCLFDNDKAGKKLSQEFTEKYDIPHFFMPNIERVTDFSDLVKVRGIDNAKKEFIKRIKKILK